MNIYISTCNEYSKLLPGFCYLANKFIPKEYKIIVLYYDNIPVDMPEIYKNVQFHSLGREADWQQGRYLWTNALRNYFEKIEDKYFIFGLDDYWMVGDIKMPDLEYNFAKFDLEHSVLENKSQRFGDFYVAAQDAEYRSSLQMAIWRKDYFLKFLQPDWTSIDFETKGNLLAVNDNEDVFGGRDIFPYVEMYNRGDIRHDAMSRLPDHIKNDLTEKGYLNESVMGGV